MAPTSRQILAASGIAICIVASALSMYDLRPYIQIYDGSNHIAAELDPLDAGQIFEEDMDDAIPLEIREEARPLPGSNRAATYWPEGERWDTTLGKPRNNYHIAVINVWLGRSLPEHTIQTLHTFSRNRNGTTYLLFTDPEFIAGLSGQISGIPGVKVISDFKIDGKRAGLTEYIHHEFWIHTKNVTREKAPWSFPLGHNLCDYRPLYGFLFREFLEDYSHWAWVDKDTFVGDLSRWVTASDLLAAEIIGMGGTKMGGKVMVSTYGQLAIFQNTARVNFLMLLDKELLFKQYKRAGTNSANTDEYHFNKLALVGAGRDTMTPPINIMYIVHSTRKRHGTLVAHAPKEGEKAGSTSSLSSSSSSSEAIPATPYTLIETSSCFSSKTPLNSNENGGVDGSSSSNSGNGTLPIPRTVKLCRKPDDAEAKEAMKFFRATFDDFDGGTAKVEKGGVDCCGWWLGKNLDPRHSGFFKFYRDDRGEWWKRRAIPRSSVRLVNTPAGKMIQWKEAIWAHVRTKMCVIDEKDQDEWLPVGHECAQGRIK